MTAPPSLLLFAYLLEHYERGSKCRIATTFKLSNLQKLTLKRTSYGGANSPTPFAIRHSKRTRDVSQNTPETDKADTLTPHFATNRHMSDAQDRSCRDGILECNAGRPVPQRQLHPQDEGVPPLAGHGVHAPGTVLGGRFIRE